jgi:signal transduction histidine kinase/ActR/RegA family two-component response regulator
MFLWWGPELIQFYNDAYLPSFGHGKHPAAMGQRGFECWQEIWSIIHPQIVDVMERGKASWNEDQLVPIYRNERLEDVYWTYGYSPVYDEMGSVGGVLVVCTETTAGVLAVRRLDFIRRLATALNDARDPMDVARITASCLSDAALDVPCAVVSVEGASPLLVGLASSQIPALVEAESGAPLAPRRLVRGLPCAACPELVTQAVVYPLAGTLSGTLTFGLSPRLPFDEAYRNFVSQIVEQIVSAEGRVSARDSLERSYAERSRLLVAAQVASRAKDEFLAMLGHELRNPLAPILTALEVMRAKTVVDLEHERQIVERQARHLVHLVDDLLDVSRVVEGKIELKKRRIALADVVATAIEMASPLLEKGRHDLRVDVSAHGLDVEADPMRLAQIVANLLTNAARYTERGGNVSLKAWQVGGDVVLRVEDTGIGIAPDQLERLFERFYQGVRRSDQAQGGLGLGLALVKSLIELHGGSVHAESAGLGKGSAFEIRLALAQGEAPVEKIPAEPALPQDVVKGERVLLIDDNEDITDLFAMFLELSGFDVRTAHDGPSALRVAAAYQPTVAVLDLGLPVMDGYEIAAKLREQLGRAAPRLIAMSGYGRKDDLDRTRAAGFEQHLVKPVDSALLLRAILGKSEVGSSA